jgi:hypothetical protein
VLPEGDRGGLDGEGRDCEKACMLLGVAFAHCPRSHLVDARLRNATGGSTVPMNGIIGRPYTYTRFVEVVGGERSELGRSLNRSFADQTRARVSVVRFIVVVMFQTAALPDRIPRRAEANLLLSKARHRYLLTSELEQLVPGNPQQAYGIGEKA